MSKRSDMDNATNLRRHQVLTCYRHARELSGVASLYPNQVFPPARLVLPKELHVPIVAGDIARSSWLHRIRTGAGTVG